MSISQLCQELIDAIIDTIAADSISNDLWPGANLLQCSLASRSFRPRSQRHIFSHIEIRGTSHQTRRTKVEKLFEIIEEDPPIADYIEELSLESLELSTACPIPVDEQVFINVMERISPLRKLKLAVASVRDLENPGPSLNNFFLPFIAPFITSLDLRRLGRVPLEAVTKCVNLKSLGLSLVDFAESDQSTKINASCTSLKLQHLTHRKSLNALDTLLRPHSQLDLSQLKAFTAYTDDNSLKQVQSVIDLTSDTLEELHLLSLDETAWVSLYHGSPTLECLTRLRSLHIHIPFCPISVDASSSLRFLCNVISSIRTGTLETLSIEAKVGFIFFPMSDDPEVLLTVDWDHVCSEIARVMTGTGSTVEFKMTYRHIVSWNITDSDKEEETLKIQNRCQVVLAKLHEHNFRSLKDNPSITLTSPSHARLVPDIDDLTIPLQD